MFLSGSRAIVSAVSLLRYYCQGFSPHSSPTIAGPSHHPLFFRPASFALLSEPSASTLELGLSEGSVEEPARRSSGSGNNDRQQQHRLELDAEGKLCLDGTTKKEVLLNGLTPTIWSASHPTASRDSLFLHASYPKERAVHESKLGDLISCERLIACARITRYWMGPKFGTSAKDIPFDTQFLLFEIEQDGPYALMLPLVDNGFRASLHYDAGSLDVICAAESGDAAVKTTQMRALFVAVDDNPYKLIKSGFRQVAEATGTFQTLDKKELPPSVDEFGWCTWDAFYSKVTPKGVLDGVKALRDAGTPPKNLILDDGWQQVTPTPSDLKEDVNLLEEVEEESKRSILSLVSSAVNGFYEKFVRKAPHGSKANKIWRALSKTVLKKPLWDYFDKETDFNRQLCGFRANQKFESKQISEGDDSKRTLKGLVTELKEQLGVKHVFCWHALHGYWRGVSEQLGKTTGLNVTNVIPKPSASKCCRRKRLNIGSAASLLERATVARPKVSDQMGSTPFREISRNSDQRTPYGSFP